MGIFNFFNTKNRIELQKRSFEPVYFKNLNVQNEIEQKGYAIIKQGCSEEMIDYMKSSYETLTQMEGFETKDLFVNSGRFESSEIRNFAINAIEHFSTEVLSAFVNIENCDYKNGGSFQIKPPSKKSDLNPHQDSPIIDERNYYAIFVWVALCDINEKNGALQVLPKSHLWGNFQRSLNVKWPFEKHTQLLKDEMKPIYLNKGDIILFDSALIHSSLPNLSEKPRIAFNTAILPKNHQQVHYYKDKNTPKGKVEQYYITQEFYRNHNIMEKPKSPFYLKETQEWIFPMISKKDLKHLIKLSKNDDV